MPPVVPSIIPLLSEHVRDCARAAWVEAGPVAEVLPKHRSSIVARFFPTDACDLPIDAAISEYPAKVSVPWKSTKHMADDYR